LFNQTVRSFIDAVDNALATKWTEAT
jgi:hypothetical protein